MDTDTSTLRRYYEELRGTEHAKNTLIEDLLDRLDTLSQEFQQEKLDHARESHFNRDVQRRELHLQDELRTVKAMVERDAFVLVLIDGDGMIFDDHLIQKGEAGGREAAGQLWTAVRDYVHQKMTGLSSDYKIVTRIYANLKGLGDVCYRSGIAESPGILEDFMRGFTGGKQLFDFIDVGSGKDRADDKICELFKLHLYNCHCRHIIFGCSHDNGYARLLEDVADQPMVDQITLLEGVPFERELATLKCKYETTKFVNLFRTSKINLYQQPYHTPQPQPQSTRPTLPPQMQSQTVPVSMQQSPQNMTLAQHVPYQSPYQPVISHSQAPPNGNLSTEAMARTPSTANGNTSMNPMAPSWATVGAPRVQVASPPLTPQPARSAASTIPRNKYGQRVDAVMQYDKSEMKRVQKIKMCNVHFLRQDCPYGDDCEHDHFYKPNKNELLTLRYVARQTPCRFGTGCDDIKCIYGHRCPTGTEGSKDCRFGSSCRFDPDMHGIDLKVVRTTKIS